MAEGRWSGRSRHRADSRRGSHREPLAVAWGARDATTRGATVVAAFERERLSDGLARLHAQGFGPSARVLDGGRGDLAGQLARVGLPADLVARLAGDIAPKTASLLVVHAPARSEQVADLLRRAGAVGVEVVPPVRGSEETPSPIVPLPSEAAVAEAGA